jgi:hypothetical protein
MALFTTTFPNTVRTISGSAVSFADDVVLLCDTSVGAVTLTLQEIPANNWNLLYKLFVLDNSNNAGTNPITINAPSGQTINLGSSVVINSNGPLTSSGGATPNISIPQATALLNGYLSSTDWNAFNSKGSPLAIINNVGGTVTTSATSIRFDTNLTTSNVGGAVTVSAAGGGGVTSVGVTAPVANSGTSTAPVINMAAANGSTDGYLTQANWTTFNNKGEPFDVAKNSTNVVSDVTNINFNTDFNVTASVTPNKVNIAISSGTWTDLVGFEHQKTITSVQFPQCRVIGNLLYFRGTAIVPLASDLAGTTYVAPSSTTLIYASNPHPFVFQGSSGLIKGCLIAGILNKSIEFNLGGSVIPPSISYTIGSPTNTGWRIYNRGIETLPTRGSLLTTIGKVELDTGGILRYLPYNYAEVTWTSDPSCIGNGRWLTADVDAGNGALDWRVVNATLSPGASTTHSSNPGFTSFWDSSYPVRSASYIFPFSAETAIAENMGGFMIELDGLIGFPP